MPSRSARLKLLFKEWKKAQENEPDEIWLKTKSGHNITKAHFREDGIIDEETYEMEKRKVLFISNEANDDEYSAKTKIDPSNISDYRNYSKIGYDDWKGKMRERTSELYKVVADIPRNEMSDPEAALHYAVMDINKRGGGSDIKGGDHIEAYCRYYKDFIKKEISIIEPDVVVWLGVNTYDRELHSKYLGAIRQGDKRYFMVNGKKIPIMRMWHTAYRYGSRQITPLPEYGDSLVGSLCAKCLSEAKRYNLI